MTATNSTHTGTTYSLAHFTDMHLHTVTIKVAITVVTVVVAAAVRDVANAVVAGALCVWAAPREITKC